MKRRPLVLLLLVALGAVGIGVAGLLNPGSSGAAPPAARGDTSITLTIDGTAVATFNRCTGIGSQTTPETSGSGTSKSFGTNQPIAVTCERTGPVQQLWTWRQQAVVGDATARRSAQLDVTDSTGAVVQRYSLLNAWVSGLDDTARVGSDTTEVATFTADEIIATFSTSAG